jgi:hypothetical protein
MFGLSDVHKITGEARMKQSICLIAVLATASTTLAADSATPGNNYVPADKIPWVDETGAPVQLGSLWGDRASGEAGTLLRTPAGFKAGPHSHTADYWAVVIEGVWEHWVPSTGEGTGIRLESGSHWTQVKTQVHEDACVSDVPCVIFLFNKTPYATEFVPAP